MIPPWRRVLAWLAAGLTLAACQPAGEPAYAPSYAEQPPRLDKPVYLFGVHPLHNPQHLFEVYQPLVDYLNRHLDDVQIKLEASRDYASFDTKLAAKKFEFALPNPYQTVVAAENGYRIFGKMGDNDNFRGIILVRKDSGIQTVADLKGKAISYPAPTALAATMLPQWFLHEQGLDVMHEVENRYVGSQESSIMNVYQGFTAAGATWPPPWRALSKARPEVAAALDVRWQTDSLPNNGLVARADVPADRVARVGALLFGLQEHEEGRRILAAMELSRYEPADQATYAPVREFLARFEARVRPLKTP